MQRPMTLSYAEDQLSKWMAALERCSTGETYSLGNRTLTRQDVEDVIIPQITRWHRTVASIEAANDGKSRPLAAQASFAAPGSGAGALYPDSLWRDGRT